jgi:hypothetical protein
MREKMTYRVLLKYRFGMGVNTYHILALTFFIILHAIYGEHAALRC